MYKRFLTRFQIEKIFKTYGLETVEVVKHINNPGMKNSVHIINDKYVLKVCNTANHKDFKKELRLYRFFQNKIPVPKIIASDTRKEVFSRSFEIYQIIQGDNLFSQWHQLTNPQRAKIIKQISDIIKVINTVDYHKLPAEFNIFTRKNWYETKYQDIIFYLSRVEKRKILTKGSIQVIRRFVEKHRKVLKAQKLGLTYWDIHFDNFLVKGTKVVGVLDFDGVAVMSIDYALDSIRRLTSYPQIYASETNEHLVKKADYNSVMKLFKEYYPELFNFPNLSRRIDLYSIEYDIGLLLQFPKAQQLRDRLSKTLRVVIR
jgi:aminoglycoside phosphotransferase